MPNSKLNPRYNVVSLRVTDEEKAALDEVTRRTRKSLSMVVREAIQLYSRDVTLFSGIDGYEKISRSVQAEITL
jgi:predicted transcriptional regulator